jgi:hypothetical protein
MAQHEACEQKAFAALVRIDPDRVAELRELLASIGNDINDNPHVDFTRFGRIHFMRWVILDASHDLEGNALPPQLLLSTNYDAALADPDPLRTHLGELVGEALDAVRRIYGACEGFDPSWQPGATVAYLERHAVPYEAFYVGTVLRSVAQVRDEAALREDLEQYLDAHAAELVDGKSAVALRERLQAFVAGGPHAWALEQWPAEGIPLRLRQPRTFLFLLGGALVLAMLGVPAVVWWLLGGRYAAGLVLGVVIVALLLARVLRYRENTDPEHTTPPPPTGMRELVAREDRIVQNQMTSVTPMKPGKFRRFTVRGVFFVINTAARFWYTRGKLGEIPSIHFARWILIDDDRRMLFLSNFDGSWENYLGDFIDKASEGLTAVWSNTHMFPRSRWLVDGGAKNEQVFKAMVRDSQAPTEVWYSAYPRLTVENVNRNTAIRVGLSGPMTEKEASAWLQLL